MNIRFHKMHGAGNDYIYVDARAGREQIEDPEQLSIKISDRHFGVGSDGLVLIMDSEVADFRMRMFNADGSEGKMCGNAARCVGKYLYELGLSKQREITLETLSGIKILKLSTCEGVVTSVTIDMGEPSILPSEIPMLGDSNRVTVENYKLTCVSMGNPHAVTFVDDVENFPVEQIGKILENHSIFPERCNIEFAQIISQERIKMRVWERGSGETLACGTGACATLVASSILNLSTRSATIELLGGDLRVDWDAETNHIFLTGGAEWVFEGVYNN